MIVLASSEDVSFLSSIPIWGWLDIAFTFMVLAGVAGESDWAERLLIPDKLLDLMPVESKRKILKRRFEVILIIGVAGELACLPFSLWESSKQNERAAMLQTTNTILGIKLEELRRPLALNDEKRASLLQCLNSVEIKGKVWVNFSVLEQKPSYGLGQDILVILKQAKFETDFWDEGDNPAYGILDPGIVFVVKDPSNVPNHIREITNCLRKVDLPMTIRGPNPSVPMNVLNSSNAIIFIHPKF